MMKQTDGTTGSTPTRAKTEYRTAQQVHGETKLNTVSVVDTGRVVATQQNEGDIALRYEPEDPKKQSADTSS